jgi:hypothetical protein
MLECRILALRVHRLSAWLFAVALCSAPACQQTSFESLGVLPAPRQFEPSDAGNPLVPVNPVAAGAGAGPAAAVPPAAGSAGAPAAGSGGGSSGGTAGAGGGSAGGGAPSPLTGSVGTKRFDMVKTAFVIGNPDEPGTTTVYLLDSSVTCSQISLLAWLTQLPTSVHVVEIVFSNAAPTGTALTSSAVSYASGGMYSFAKTHATTSSLVLSLNKPATAVEGTLTATFATGSVMGLFHADVCASGVSF